MANSAKPLVGRSISNSSNSRDSSSTVGQACRREHRASSRLVVNEQTESTIGVQRTEKVPTNSNSQAEAKQPPLPSAASERIRMRQERVKKRQQMQNANEQTVSPVCSEQYHAPHADPAGHDQTGRREKAQEYTNDSKRPDVNKSRWVKRYRLELRNGNVNTNANPEGRTGDLPQLA